MKKNLFIFAAATALLFSACSPEQDDFFSDSSANRADQSIINDMEILTSAPYGWSMTYFPSATQSYGGFNFVVSFSKDGKVTFSAESDISDDTSKKATSLYSIVQSSGVTLTFDTYNDIFSLMADPSAPIAGSSGEGMGGDNEFSILSACPDSVILKGRASGNKAVLYPMKNDDWKGYLDELYEVDSKMYASSYTLLIGEDSITVSTDMRGLSITYIEDGKYVTTYASYIITKRGMEFYKPFEFKGKTITGFKLDDDNDDKFESFDDPNVQILRDPINRQFVNSLWGMANENIGAYGQYYWKRWATAAANSDSYPGEILLAAFGKFAYNVGLVFETWNEDEQDYIIGQIYFDYELVGDNRVILSCRKTGDDYGQMMYGEGYNYACAPFGLLKPFEFELSSDNLKEGIDLKCLTETKVGSKVYSNDMHLTRSFTAWPLRDPADRED